MIVLLHGWPGDPEDWREVVPLLDEEPVVPELLWQPEVSAAALARHVAGLIDEPAVIAGYDVGSSSTATAMPSAPTSGTPGATGHAPASSCPRTTSSV